MPAIPSQGLQAEKKVPHGGLFRSTRPSYFSFRRNYTHRKQATFFYCRGCVKGVFLLAGWGVTPRGKEHALGCPDGQAPTRAAPKKMHEKNWPAKKGRAVAGVLGAHFSVRLLCVFRMCVRVCVPAARVCVMRLRCGLASRTAPIIIVVHASCSHHSTSPHHIHSIQIQIQIRRTTGDRRVVLPGGSHGAGRCRRRGKRAARRTDRRAAPRRLRTSRRRGTGRR